ncbi:MAG: DEAD/DEAH box helicase [Lachnospiraceae bacterium]|nr:DEAD/DEAH box helicase [Lachnospiraceae bacterium]
MKNYNLTIRMIKNTSFPEAYEEFLLERDMNVNKYRSVLSLATLFLNSSDENVRKLGYRIIVIYCNRTKDYMPLYDIAANQGIVPVTQFIEDSLGPEKERNVFTEINASANKNFVINNVFCTLQQKELIDFYNGNQQKSLSVVAPTSYGKTDLIIHTINDNPGSNVCVITPTKSLLAQTKARILQANKGRKIKIITHPEMYNESDTRVLSVMTQERTLRLLKMVDALNFDFVVIDEAHGLLHDDDRNILLASVIMILSKRNPNATFKFLTPFLCDANSIKVRYTGYNLVPYKVDEYIKTERIYIAEMRDKRVHDFLMYDQFVNKSYRIGEVHNDSEWSFIKEHAGAKNIVYFNKPKDIEAFANTLIEEQQIEINDKIKKACSDIAEYVHPRYRLIDCIKSGFIYHHGDVPETIRMYIEKLYVEIPEIKYVLTSSTLLEGVNLPADKMFILDNKKGTGKLTPSDFKNLIGRVCRFSQIFDKNHGTLKRLEPEIYLVVGQYYSVNANVNTFIQESMCVEKKISDEPKNVLLESSIISQDNSDELDRAREFVENYEDGVIPNYNLRKAETEVGQKCFINNITEIDIFKYEHEIESVAKSYLRQNKLINTTEKLFDALFLMFFNKSSEDNIRRFEYDETKRFYKMFLDWRIKNTSLNEMIYSFMRYWKGLVKDNQNPNLVYVGRWGDEKRGGVKPLWTDISTKTDYELVNLAIVRIKEEQDFLDNILLKYVEVLNDIGLLDENLYLLIKYGTDDPNIITCTKNGISLSLSQILVEKYNQYIEIDSSAGTVQFQEGIIQTMEAAGENQVMVCELGYFL